MEAENLNAPNAGRTCPNCGFVSPAGDKFCSQCGHSMNEHAATTVGHSSSAAQGQAEDYVPLPPPPTMVRKKRVQKRKWYKRPLIMVPLILLLIAGTVGGVIAYQTRSAFKDVQSISTPPPEVSSNALGIEDASPIDTGPAQRALEERQQQRATINETPTPGSTTSTTESSNLGNTTGATEDGATTTTVAATEDTTTLAQAGDSTAESTGEPSSVTQSGDQTPESTESTNARTQMPLTEPGGITVLLMGVDARDGESIDVGVRPDSLAVLHVDEETGSCRVLAVPRDSRAQLPGYGESKINHALAVGGIPYEMAVIEDYLGLSIDHYVLVDFSGLEKVVDEFGGVTVENPEAFEMSGKTFDAGTLRLNGEDALLYARFRGDSQGDFGRISRQQQVLRSLLDQANNSNLVRVIPSMFSLLSDNFRTDYGVTDLLSLANDYRDTCTADSLETRTIPGDVGLMYDDMMQMELSFVTSTPEQVAENVAWLLQNEDTPTDPAGTPAARHVLPVAVLPDRRGAG